LISYGYWQSRFGGARDAVGSTLNLDGSLLTVIGVMPRDFLFLYEADVWRLVDRTGPFDGSRGSHSHFVVGRLKPGVSIEQAQGEADGISASLAQQYPESNSTKGLLLMEMRSFMAYGIKTSMLLLLATTALILLIACGNVAGLMLARGERRLSEMAMRSALGASRSRLLRQLVTESVVLTGAAGLLGIGIAYSLQDSLLPLLPSGELGTEQPSINMAALAFTLAISIATGLIVGIVPALRGTALKPAQQLRSGNHASESLRSGRLRSGLVVLQVALSVALLIGSALMVRSFAQLSRVELGFSTENLLTGQLQIQAADYPTPEQRSLFYSSLLEEVEALPGVESATLINKLPIMSPWQDWSIWRAELPPPTAENDFSAMARWVPPGYFQTMGMQLLAGRDIAATDVPGSPYVIVVSERVARTLFEDADPVGRQVRIGWSDRSFEVIGVVRDARVNTLRGEPDAAAYMASAQIGATRMQIAVRSSGDPMLLVGPIEGLLRRKDPNVLFAYPRAMSSIIDSRLSSFRIVILSLSLFSVLALALTAIGLYGILAYHVSQRTNEIGVRLAMGASNGDMLGMVLRKGLALVGIGLVLGVAAAYPGTLLVRQLLFETQPIDLAAYMVAVVFLGVVATLACLLPAWRATRVDVVDVLRIE
jgi:putative ABC transport system permease protein